MYRSLCDRGSFTEYEYVLQIPNSRPLNYSQSNSPPPPAFRLSAPPRFPLGPSDSTMQCRGTKVYRPIQFASVTQSEGTRGSVCVCHTVGGDWGFGVHTSRSNVSRFR